MIKQTLLSVCIASAAVFGLSACDDNDNNRLIGSTDVAAVQNIVGLAQSNQSLSILVDAVVSADLGDTLASNSAPAPFTVFAPTNAAFAALLKEKGITKAQLLADKALLKSVLTNHVIAGKAVKKVDVPLGKPIQTLQGNAITVTKELKVMDAMNAKAGIVKTDLVASNGVVHVIDKVLLPAEKNIVSIAQSNADFSILVEAVVAAGLADTLATTDNITVFAPTNAAFAALLKELNVTKEALLANKALLTEVLKYHVVADRVYSSEVQAGKVATLQGGQFTVNADMSLTDERSRKAMFSSTDIQASNGVIHVIDKVILPKAK